MINDRLNPKTSLIISVVIGVTLISFFPVLNHGWVNWDDPDYVLNNTLIQEIHAGSLADFFTTLQVQGLYHPLTLMSLAFDYQLAADSPWLFHAHNLLLHVFNTMLVFWLVLKLGEHKLVAGICAVFFAIHPMHVESVAWVSERKDVLYTFYFLLTLILYVHYIGSPTHRRRYYFAALICFLLSLLAKGMAVTLSVILILIDRMYRDEKWSKILIEKVPFLCLSLAFGIVVIVAQKAGNAMYDIQDLEWYRTIFVGFYGLLLYIWKLFVPIGLSAFHPYPMTDDGGFPWFIYASVIPILLLVYLFLKYAWNHKKIAFGVLFFIISITPVLQVLSVGKAIIAERFTYVSYIGLFYTLAYFWYENLYINLNSKNKTYSLISIGLIVIVFSAMTHTRNQVWNDNITLWSDVIDKYPDNHLAYCNRASSYVEMNALDQALLDCNKCIALNPELYESFNNRALINIRLKQYDAALNDLNHAVQMNPKYAHALANRAALFVNLNKLDQAMADLKQLSALNAHDAGSQFNLALIYFKKLEYQVALQEINKSISLQSDVGMYYYFRSKIYTQLKMYQQAVQDLKLARAYGHRFDHLEFEQLQKFIHSVDTIDNE